MTEADVVQQMIKHCESAFPKTCPNCQCVFPTLKNYLQNTVRLGKAVSYDMEVNDFQPADPMGAIATATCRCGTTLALSSDGPPPGEGESFAGSPPRDDLSGSQDC